MRILSRTVTTVAAALLALSLGQAAASAQSEPLAPPITWEDCPATVNRAGAQCGRIDVPTYYDNPGAGTISIGFVRVPAAKHSRGMLFLNPGGPGGDAYAYAGNTAQLWPAGITEEWDMVGVQPRGLPGSTPLDCTGSGGSEIDGYLNSGAYLHNACESKQPGYSASITTYNTARDWDMVRLALGQDHISILGTSYGTYLGSAYATLFPQRTDRLILDSAMSTSVAWNKLMVTQDAGYQMAYQDFFSYVAVHDGEYHLGTTPLKVYERWAQRIQSEVGVRPTTVPPTATIGDLPAGLEFTGQMGANLITATGQLRVNAQFLGEKAAHPQGAIAYSPTFAMTRIAVAAPAHWPELAQHLAGQIDLTTSALTLTPEQQQAVADDMLAAQNMQNVIMCNENQTAGTPAYLPVLLWSSFVTVDPYATLSAAYASGAACNGYAPVTRPVALDGSHLRTRPLQIAATRDPQTVYSLHGETARAMGSHVLTVHGPGHGQVGTGNAAVDAAVVDYLRTGQTSVTDVNGLY